jgi:two-component system, chemotaxis family, protein-glutamate methylesterase/glutaminase
VIVMGGSLGSTQAAQLLLADLRPPFTQSLAIALHRHRDSYTALVELLQRDTSLKVYEALDKQPLEPGSVYIAPPDYHLLVDGDHLALSVDEPVRFARPCIDVLFESAAASFGRDTVAVVLTGGGVDGSRGAVAVEAVGGLVLVQEPDEAVAPDMPKATIAATERAEVLGIGGLADRLMQLAK